MNGTLPTRRRSRPLEEFQDFYDAAERLCEDYENIFYMERGFHPLEAAEVVEFIRELFQPDEFKVLMDTKIGRGIIIGVVITMREVNYRQFFEGDDGDS